MRALVHRQLPTGSNFIVAQNVQVAVAAPDFDVPIVGAMPLVDVIGHLDFTTIEAKSPHFFGAAFVHIGFDPDLHGVASLDLPPRDGSKHNRTNWLLALIVIKSIRHSSFLFFLATPHFSNLTGRLSGRQGS